MARGETNRSVGATQCNERSSRSHRCESSVLLLLVILSLSRALSLSLSLSLSLFPTSNLSLSNSELSSVLR
jgi:hypothetical protein